MHIKLKRIAAIAIVFSLVMSMVFTGNFSIASAAQSLLFDVTSEITTTQSDWDVFYEYGSLSVDQFSHDEITVSGSGRKILTLKAGKIPSGKTMKSISFVLSGDDTYFCNFAYGIDDEKVYGFRGQPGQNYSGLYHKLYYPVEGEQPGESAIQPTTGWNFWGADFASMLDEKTAKVVITYDQENGKTEIAMSRLDGTYTKLLSYEVPPKNFVLYLSEGMTVSDLKLTVFEKKDFTGEVNNFNSKYASLLEGNDVTLAHEQTVADAVADFEALPQAVQDQYVGTELKLQMFAEKIAALKENEPYDCYSPLQLANWTAIKGNLLDTQIDGEDIVTAPSAGGPLWLMMNQSAIGGQDMQVMRVTYKFKKAVAQSSEGVPIVYEYTDENNYKYLSLWYHSEWGGGGFLMQNRVVTNGESEVTQTVTQIDIDLAQENTVVIDYSTEGKAAISVTSDGHLWTLDRTVDAELPHAVVIGTASTFSQETVRYSNVKVVALSEENIRGENKTIETYLKKHREVLYLSDNMVVVNYKDAVNAALSDWNTLSEYAKNMTAAHQQKLLYLQSLIQTMEQAGTQPIPERGDNDYSDFSDDFENSLYQWSNVGEYVQAPEIVYNEVLKSNVVKLNGRTKITPSSFVMPVKAKLKEVSYKLLIPKENGNIWNAVQIPISYNDKDNYVNLSVFKHEATDTKFSRRVDKAVNGTTSTDSQSLRSLTCDYTGTWLTISITYDQNGAATVTVFDGQNTDVIVVNGTVNTKPALIGAGLTQAYAHDAYIDDYKVTMEQGTWVEDIVIENINIYKVNSFGIRGDDVLMLQGEKLYDTVASAYIIPLNDVDTASIGYIQQVDFDTLGITSAYVAPASAVAQWNKYVNDLGMTPTKLSLLQPNDHQVKVVLPKNIKNGIYAIKLEGYDKLSDKDDLVIYINAPQINAVLGSDGATCEPGETLKIRGENLALYDQRVDEKVYIDADKQTDGFHNEGVKVILKNAQREYLLSGDSIQVKSEGYIEAVLPEGIVDGEYEIFLYNGFGDETCWSAPCNDKVTVKQAPYRSWSQTVFNVKDFGATGDVKQNATGAVINALTAAAENGGGIVYFPEGTYTVIYSLVIPENVQFIGDSKDRSVIIWNPEQWKWNSCPDFLLGFTGNVVIRDLGLYATRCHDVVKNFNTASYANVDTYEQNVYLKNLFVHVNPNAARITGGDTAQQGTGMESAEMQSLVKAESAGHTAVYLNKIDNLRIENCTVNRWMHRESGLRVYYAANSYIGSTETEQAMSVSHFNNVVMEYTSTTHSGAGGRDFTTYGNSYKNSVDNNRELTVTDGNNRLYGIRMYKDTSDSTGRTYILNRSFGKDVIVGRSVYVYSGQGLGQLREVVSNTGTKVVFTEPFLIEPNTNSLVIIDEQYSRCNMQSIKNHYYNGSATGAYSAVANISYDSCEWDYVSDIYIQSRVGEIMWYISYVNGIYGNAYGFHNIGEGNDVYAGTAWTGPSYFALRGNNFAYGVMNATYRNNDFDGYRFVSYSAYQDNVAGVVFDKNTFRRMDYALDVASALDGVMAYKNVLEDVTGGLCKQEDTMSAATNNCGSKRYMNYIPKDALGGFDLGDVNGDGQIDREDAVRIEEYLAGNTVLTAVELKRADFFTDGQISAKDATAIKYYLVHGTVLSPSATPGDVFYPGIW